MEVSAGCGDAAAHVAPLLRRVYVFHDGENAYIPPTVNNGGGLFNDVVVRVRACAVHRGCPRHNESPNPLLLCRRPCIRRRALTLAATLTRK